MVEGCLGYLCASRVHAEALGRALSHLRLATRPGSHAAHWAKARADASVRAAFVARSTKPCAVGGQLGYHFFCGSVLLETAARGRAAG